MARLSYLIVDGLAFVMIGVGLTASYLGVERKLPVPSVHQERLAASRLEPAMTGAIAEKLRDATPVPIATQPKRAGETVGQPPSAARAWVDPPRR
jgi:hypothetical protein